MQLLTKLVTPTVRGSLSLASSRWLRKSSSLWRQTLRTVRRRLPLKLQEPVHRLPSSCLPNTPLCSMEHMLRFRGISWSQSLVEWLFSMPFSATTSGFGLVNLGILMDSEASTTRELSEGNLRRKTSTTDCISSWDRQRRKSWEDYRISEKDSERDFNVWSKRR